MSAQQEHSFASSTLGKYVPPQFLEEWDLLDT